MGTGCVMAVAGESAECPICHQPFQRYHRLHLYDTDRCRRTAGLARHGMLPASHRKRTPRFLGTCRWCHCGIWAEDGHTEPREFCGLSCRSAYRAAQCDAESMARFLERISHPQPPAPSPEYRVIDGIQVEVVWTGSSKRSLVG